MPYVDDLLPGGDRQTAPGCKGAPKAVGFAGGGDFQPGRCDEKLALRGTDPRLRRSGRYSDCRWSQLLRVGGVSALSDAGSGGGPDAFYLSHELPGRAEGKPIFLRPDPPGNGKERKSQAGPVPSG